MATVRQTVTDALTEIGVYQPGEPPSAADAALGLRRFQMQLEAWQAEKLTLYNFTTTIYTLPSGTSTRTIGPTGQITLAQNPVFLNGINYVVPGSSSGGTEVPMGRMDDDSYATLAIKGLPSALPMQWYFNPGSANGTLTFWPVESQDVTIKIYSYLGVGVPATLDDTIAGPPGYAEAFLYQLALRLMTPFAVPASAVPLLPQLAAESLARIKRVNVEPGLLGVDQALVPTYGGAYNIISDQTSAPSNR